MGRSAGVLNPRSQPITDRKYRLAFGKYKNVTLEDVLEVDGQYLVWLHGISDHFELSADLLREAEGSKDEPDPRAVEAAKEVLEMPSVKTPTTILEFHQLRNEPFIIAIDDDSIPF
jgi:hypothetical protein